MTQISDLTLSTSSNTRWKFLRRTSATSWSVQFLCRSSSIRAGYFDTSSKPRGKLSKKNTFYFRKKNECARTVFCVSQYMLIQHLFCDTAFWTQWCLQQRNQIIHRSTATIRCSSPLFMPARGTKLLIFAIFQPVDSRDSQIADIVTGKQKHKIDLVQQQLLENESARDKCEHGVCFILVTVSICKVSLWQSPTAVL